MNSQTLPKSSGSVCRYPPRARAWSFILAFGVGLLAGLVQLIATPMALSIALLTESVHALTDSALLWPALLAAWISYRNGHNLEDEHHDRLADWMARIMIASGILAIVLSLCKLGFDVGLHADAGVGPAIFGLGANGGQLLLLLWCRKCRFHRLSISHLFADTMSSVFVSCELFFHLDALTGLPVDALGGALIGGWLIKQGLEGGHTH